MSTNNIFVAVLSTNNQTATENPPPQKPEEAHQEPPLMSPSTKKSFFKKNIEDGMDKYENPKKSINVNTKPQIEFFCRVLEQVNFEKKFSSLPQFKPDECQSPSAISVPSSPRVFNNYHKKRGMSMGHRSSVDEEAEPETPQSACKSASASRHVTGNTFFGPDFNLENVKGQLPVQFFCFISGEFKFGFSLFNAFLNMMY